MYFLVDDSLTDLEGLDTFGTVVKKPANFAHLTDQQLKPVTGLVIRSKSVINESLLQRLPNLGFIGCCVAGQDHLDLAAIRKRNIQLVNAAGCNANSVAEYVHLAIWALQVSRASLTIGVVGFGHVGQAVCYKALLLGYRVVVYDPPVFSQANPFVERENLSITDDLDALSDCDVISLHASLNSHPRYPSENIIDEPLLKRLDPEQILINTGRGELINEKALLRQCQSQQSPRLVLDCWRAEPDINSQLLAYCKLATPHIAGHSQLAKQLASRHVLQHLKTSQVSEPSCKPFKAPASLQLSDHQRQRLFQFFSYQYQPSQDDLRHFDPHKSLHERFQMRRNNYPKRLEWHQINTRALVDSSLLEQAQPLLKSLYNQCS